MDRFPRRFLKSPGTSRPCCSAASTRWASKAEESCTHAFYIARYRIPHGAVHILHQVRHLPLSLWDAISWTTSPGPRYARREASQVPLTVCHFEYCRQTKHFWQILEFRKSPTYCSLPSQYILVEDAYKWEWSMLELQTLISAAKRRSFP
jgi:hypothetical protein